MPAFHHEPPFSLPSGAFWLALLLSLSGTSVAWAQEGASTEPEPAPTESEAPPADGDADAAEPEAETPSEDSATEPTAEPAPDSEPERPEAEQHLRAGAALLQHENYEGALVEFQLAYGLLEGHPQRHYTLFNIARCHERLFRYHEALVYFGRYLDEGGAEEGDADDVRATIATLDGLLGTVEVTANIASGEVWLDDRPVAELVDAQARVRVTGGRHTIEVRADGHAARRRQVEVVARRDVSVNFELAALSDYEGVRPWLFWTSAGLAIGSLVAGAVLGTVALVEHSRLEDLTQDPSDPRRFEVMQADNERVQGLALSADILLGAGALLGVISTVLYFVTDWGHGDAASGAPDRAALRWTLHLDTRERGGGLRLDMAF